MQPFCCDRPWLPVLHTNDRSGILLQTKRRGLTHVTRVPHLISVETHIEMSMSTQLSSEQPHLELLRHETLVSRDDQG